MKLLLKNKFFIFYPLLFLFLQQHASLFRISPNVMYAIILNESKGNPFAVNFNCKNKIKAYFLYKNIKNKFPGIKIFLYKKYVSVYPKNFLSAKKLFNMIKYLNSYYKSMDLGLMQLNSNVLKKQHIKLQKAYFNVFLNLRIGAGILYKCFLKFRYKYKGNIKTIECYNKGFNDEKFNNNYFNRVYRNYVFIRQKY